MFKFLKEKIKSWVKSSKDKVEEKTKEIKVEAPIKEKAKKKLSKQTTTSPPITPQKITEKEEQIPTKQVQEEIQQTPEKKGFFSRIKESIVGKYKITDEYFNEIFDQLELILLENNVPIITIDKIKEELKKELINKEVSKSDVEHTISLALKNAIYNVLQEPEEDLIKKIQSKKPFVILFFGINGSGKTTSIAKLANYLKTNNLTSVLAASDTFRAASIEQISKHASKLGIKVVKHDYGADPAAVAFDAIKHAKSNNIDAVLIDTAGRMHTKNDLMREMEKIVRVTKPDLKVFVGESTTGSDVIEQAKTFNEAVGIDGVILSKADIDEKGGVAISVSNAINKPILFLGTGQNYEDLKPFKKDDILRELDL
ncbi:MAG: signal recognition particle-docking protein FtsY [Nanoarchaeota archaeon]|nr:signal recognition particle-docking protein FtsY [Nanoarchaeota archaeon]